MNIHEYQAKAVLARLRRAGSNGPPAFTPDEAEAAAKELGGPLCVVKARSTPAGAARASSRRPRPATRAACGSPGRSTRSSIRRADARRDAGDGADRPGRQAGQPALYRGRLGHRQGVLPVALVDRATARIAFVVSTEGGVNIEDVAHNTPEKIVSFAVDPATGVMPHHGRTAAKALGLHRRPRQAMRERW